MQSGVSSILLTYVDRDDLIDLVDEYSKHVRDDIKLNPLTLCHVGKAGTFCFAGEITFHMITVKIH